MIAPAKKFKWWPVYLIGAVVCAVITITIWATVIGPSLRQQQQRAAQIRDLGARRHKAAALQANLAATERKQAEIEKATAATRLLLDPSTLINSHMVRITQEAGACGLTIDQVQPGKTSQTPFYTTVELRIAGSGAFPDVTRFLHHLNENCPDLSIRAMSLSTAAGNALSPPAGFQMDLIWFAAPTAAPSASTLAGGE